MIRFMVRYPRKINGLTGDTPLVRRDRKPQSLFYFRQWFTYWAGAHFPDGVSRACAVETKGIDAGDAKSLAQRGSAQRFLFRLPFSLIQNLTMR
jgi:hypothetical protein